MKDEYTFVAVLDCADDGISVSFPDLPGCFTCADSGDIDGAVKNAQEALSLHLCCMEKDGEVIPNPTMEQDIVLDKGQKTVLVMAYLPPVRLSICPPNAA